MSQYYNYENSKDELMHYGVKGMRWGVRRQRTTEGINAARKAGKETAKHNTSYSGYYKYKSTDRRSIDKQYRKDYDDAYYGELARMKWSGTNKKTARHLRKWEKKHLSEIDFKTREEGRKYAAKIRRKEDLEFLKMFLKGEI